MTKKLVVWQEDGEKIIYASCDVDDEEVMLEVMLDSRRISGD